MPHPTARGPLPGRLFTAVLLLASVVLGGCGTVTSTGRVPADPGASWALLPIDNLSSTPLAGRKAATLVETRLRARGVTRVSHVEARSDGGDAGLALVALIDDGANRDAALVRARANGHRYAMTGTVHEWHYKSAPDREPVVGLNLSLIDVSDGQVMWQGSASRSGWGNASLSAVADRVVGELLGDVALQLDAAPADR